MLGNETVREIGYVVANEIIPMELLKSRQDVVYFGLAVATNVVLPISEVWFDTIGLIAESIYKAIAPKDKQGKPQVNPASASRAAAIAVMVANIPLTYVGIRVYEESESAFGRYLGAVMIMAAVFSTWTSVQILFKNDIELIAKRLGLG